MTLPAPDAALCRLLAGLPPVEPGTELLIQPQKDGGHIAVMRPEGRAPTAYVLRGETVHEFEAAGDPRLPGRALLADLGRAAATLTPQLGPHVGGELVAWRPGRRAVVCLRGLDGTPTWLKLFEPKAFANACAAAAAVQQVPAPLRLLVPAVRLPEHGALATAHAPGRSLRQLLAAGEPLPLPLLARGLQALARTSLGATTAGVDFTAARHAAVTMLRRGAALLPPLATLVPTIEQLAAPAAAPAGCVHGDLHDKQVFVDAGQVAIIDLDGLGLGDPRFDAVNLAEHLLLAGWQFDRVDPGLADALLRAVDLDPASRDVRAFRAVVRARLAGVWALRPLWHGLAKKLAAATADLLTTP